MHNLEVCWAAAVAAPVGRYRTNKQPAAGIGSCNQVGPTSLRGGHDTNVYDLNI